MSHVKDWYIGYLLLYKKLLQILCFKATFIIHSLCGSRVWVRHSWVPLAARLSKLCWREFTSKHPHLPVGRPQVLASYDWGPQFLLAAGRGLPQSLARSYGLLHGPGYNMAADLSLNMREKQKPQSFYNLVSEVVFYHFCLVLCVRSETWCPAHAQGEGIT